MLDSEKPLQSYDPLEEEDAELEEEYPDLETEEALDSEKSVLEEELETTNNTAKLRKQVKIDGGAPRRTLSV